MNDKDKRENWLEDLAKMGIGMALFTTDRIREEIERLFEEEDVSVDMKENLKERLVRRAEEEKGQIRKNFKGLLNRGLEEAGFVRQEELEGLKKRLDSIESRLEGESRDKDEEEN